MVSLLKHMFLGEESPLVNPEVSRPTQLCFSRLSFVWRKPSEQLGFVEMSQKLVSDQLLFCVAVEAEQFASFGLHPH